jgi:hypothetical protein
MKQVKIIKTTLILDQLQITITQADMPVWSPIQLNTKDFAVLIPGLYTQYPNMAMQITAFCTKPPRTLITPSGATIFTEGDLEIYVVQPNGTLVNAVILTGNVSSAAVVT